MERIVFLVPPNIAYEDFVRPPEHVRRVRRGASAFGSALTDMPLGVLALSAFVRGEAQTRLVDFNVALNKVEDFDFPSFREYFRHYLSRNGFQEYRPTIVGISALFITSYQAVLALAEACREVFPDSLIVAGGGVPTNMYRELFHDTACFDALCFGEGERPLQELVRAGDKRLYLAGAASWMTAEGVANGKTPRHDFIDDLDLIPLYDYSLLEVSDYRINSTISAYPCVDDSVQYLSYMSSRGCPYRCCYCSAHSVHGRKVRWYSLDRIRRDFVALKQKYGAQKIIFQDDHFLSDRGRTFRLIDMLRELELTAVFPNSLTLYALDREMLAALKSVGMTQLVMAIESGSERVLREIIHKPLNFDIVRRVVKDCRELGIFTDASIIIGFPGETKRDLESARAFLKTIHVNWFRIYTAIPLPGSELHEICAKKGYIKGDLLSANFKKATIGTEDFTTEYIQATAYDMNLELNFVDNSDLRLGACTMALCGFENAIRANADHAFAYYFAARCYDRLGDAEKAARYRQKARDLFQDNPFWAEKAARFDVGADL